MREKKTAMMAWRRDFRDQRRIKQLVEVDAKNEEGLDAATLWLCPVDARN
ncbi:unnamed protein product [Trichogramma brassicae]|uniref:Uncharacterized protein n=1 Tax=Trichogramma brassicae TaxID=86971 RepID=A0A6H5HZR1_9HYME|nr:unnamed protein product [Trichogramma brassicae]